MKKTSSVKIDSNGRVLLFVNKHDAELIQIMLYAAIKISFLQNMKEMAEAITKQEEDIKVWAKAKKKCKRKMAECILKYANRASLQADQLDNAELTLALTKTVTYIMKAKGEVAISRARGLRRLMLDHNEDLPVIIPDNLAEMEGVINDYADLVNIPISEIKKKKSLGTARIAAIQKNLDKDKADLRKLVGSYFPDLVKGFEAAAKIGKPKGRRKLVLNMHITDVVGGCNLRKVLCRATNGTKTIKVMSGKKGYAKFYGLGNGLWNVSAELCNYAKFNQSEVAVKDRKIVMMEIKLKKNTLPDRTVGGFLLKVYNQKNGTIMAGIIMRVPSIDKTYVSDEKGELQDEGLEVGAYAAIISGENVKERSVSFMIDGGETSYLEFGMEVV